MAQPTWILKVTDDQDNFVEAEFIGSKANAVKLSNKFAACLEQTNNMRPTISLFLKGEGGADSEDIGTGLHSPSAFQGGL